MLWFREMHHTPANSQQLDSEIQIPINYDEILLWGWGCDCVGDFLNRYRRGGWFRYFLNLLLEMQDMPYFELKDV